MNTITQELIDKVFAGGNYRIRTARKAGQCDYRLSARRCSNTIKPGDRYVEGELICAGFARERWCMVCMQVEADNLLAVRRVA